MNRKPRRYVPSVTALEDRLPLDGSGNPLDASLDGWVPPLQPTNIVGDAVGTIVQTGIDTVVDYVIRQQLPPAPFL